MLLRHPALPQPMLLWMRSWSEPELAGGRPAAGGQAGAQARRDGPAEGTTPPAASLDSGGLKAGDLEALVRQHYRPVQILLRRLIGPRPEAQDLVQETFLRARGRMAAGDPAAAAYLRRIAANLAAAWWRQRGRAAQPLELPDQVQSGESEPGALLAQAELEDSLRAAIAALPERCRLAFVARVLEGLEYPAVAAALGVAEATARQHVMEARQRLQRALRPFLDDRDRRGGAR